MHASTSDSSALPLAGRVVVVSPHLDDAVFSLGCAVAQASETGAQVEILTVFGGDPESTAPAGPWDARSGFTSEGDAARQRRLEDQAACATLGAQARWLTFGDEQYDRRGDAREVSAAVLAITGGADTVLLPGFPLLNPDHAWLSSTLLSQDLNCKRIGLYAEQPYLFTSHGTVPQSSAAAALEPLLRAPVVWLRVPAARNVRQQKLEAAKKYRSQLRQLGLARFGLRRMLWREAAAGGEALAWLSCNISSQPAGPDGLRNL